MECYVKHPRVSTRGISNSDNPHKIIEHPWNNMNGNLKLFFSKLDFFSKIEGSNKSTRWSHGLWGPGSPNKNGTGGRPLLMREEYLYMWNKHIHYIYIYTQYHIPIFRRHIMIIWLGLIFGCVWVVMKWLTLQYLNFLPFTFSVDCWKKVWLLPVVMDACIVFFTAYWC